MSWMFKLRGPLKNNQAIILGLLGVLFILTVWIILTSGASPIIKTNILPHPWKVLTSYGDLYRDNNLIKNIFFSIGLNLAGYVKAIIISVFFGFVIGLYPLFRGMFQNSLDALRFLPLVAVTGIFIVWFGIDSDMKINFLAFGILIFLLPVYH